MSNDKVKENIDQYGWQYQYVFDENGEKQPFGYSIGFEESFRHPEIMLFGLARDTMHTILSNIAQDLRDGRVFEPDVRTKGILSGDFEILFKPMKELFHPEYAGTATNYYKKPIRVFVMFWPDKNNILPVESGCELTVQDEALDIV